MRIWLYALGGSLGQVVSHLEPQLSSGEELAVRNLN